MAANSPQSLSVSDYNPIYFRAPPPSPIAVGRKSSFKNDDVLTEFLEQSLRVPDLILPEKIFPRQKFIDSPPVMDFEALDSADHDDALLFKLMESVTNFGCFQLKNYGISTEIVSKLKDVAVGIFEVPPEKRVAVMKSPENPYGFEEVHGDEDEIELSEEFAWSMDTNLKLKMEGIWPSEHSNYCKRMETFWAKMEKVAEKIVEKIFWKNPPRKCTSNDEENEMVERQGEMGSVCCIYKHHNQNVLNEIEWANSLKYEVIRMLIRRNNGYSHALCLHLCDGSSAFHVYSKRGWVSFTPDNHVLVITVGDQLQAWSGGQYKHVIGRATFKADHVEKVDCISMAFLYNPPSTSHITSNSKSIVICREENTISLTQQVFLALLFSLVCRFLLHIYTFF